MEVKHKMNFDETKEHKMIREEVKNFAQTVIAPIAEEIDATGVFPLKVVEQMGELGFIGIPFPEKYGGTGGDWVGMHICVEELCRADLSVGGIMDGSTALVGQELYVFGTEKQKQQWLPQILQGKCMVGFALTESQGGSDAAAIETTAELDGNQWVLNGTKQFISNIGMENTSICLVAAVSGKKERGGNIISTFIVPQNTPGFIVGKKYKKIGMNSTPTCELTLNDCKIPKENLLGDPKKGLAQHLAVLETGRITAAAMCVGLAQACLDESSSYAKKRVQFGHPIFNYQAIQFKIVDMAIAIELSRNAYLKAAWLKDQGRRHTFEATVAKIYASEMAERVASDAVQIHGGSGFMQETPVSRYFRAVKCMQILEGTSEILRMLLSRFV